MTDLQSRLSALESFEATPAGAALVKFRRAVEAWDMHDDNEDTIAAHQSTVNACEQALIAEIRKLMADKLRKRPIAWMRYVSGGPQFQHYSDEGDPPEDEGWIALYRRGHPDAQG